MLFKSVDDLPGTAWTTSGFLPKLWQIAKNAHAYQSVFVTKLPFSEYKVFNSDFEKCDDDDPGMLNIEEAFRDRAPRARVICFIEKITTSAADTRLGEVRMRPRAHAAVVSPRE